jgi:RNA polymerase sigma-70 factor (ECF subfamily)
MFSEFEADQSLLEKEHHVIVQQIMNDLPAKCKQVFAMSRIDQLSNKEIASLLDISIKTVEAQITKALKIFKKKLSEE